MKTIRISILFIFCLYHLAAFSQEKVEISDSKVLNVTLYEKGAYIERSATFYIHEGLTEVVIKNLSVSIDETSIQVKPEATYQIVGVKFQKFTPKAGDDKRLQTKIKTIQDSLVLKQRKIDAELFTLEKDRALFDLNKKLNGEKNQLSLAELEAFTDYYRTQLSAIELRKLKLSFDKEQLRDELASIQNQLEADERNQFNDDAQGLITVSLDATKAGKTSIKFSYYTPDAQWVPTYDFRIEQPEKPITVIQKAIVKQNSGEDWNNALLSFSSNKPAVSGNIPELAPLALFMVPEQSFRRNQLKSTLSIHEGKGNGSCLIYGKVTDAATNEPIPFANVEVFNYNNVQQGGTTTDFDGNFCIKDRAPGQYKLSCSYIGYETLRSEPIFYNPSTEVEIRLNSIATAITGIEVSSYRVPIVQIWDASTSTTFDSRDVSQHYGGGGSSGLFTTESSSRNRQNEYGTLQSKKPASLSIGRTALTASSQSTSLNFTEGSSLSKNYKTDQPYTIPSDNKEYRVDIGEFDLSASFDYASAPILVPSAYITASIPDWEKYDFYSSDINLYYQGTYIGKSFLNTSTVDDTLTVSLGRDPRIIIQRNKIPEKSSKSILGNSIIQTYTYTIDVRNTNPYAVQLTVEDQVPLSIDSKIDVELVEQNGANYNQKEGKLTWKLKLLPLDQQKLTFSYKIKYPTNKVIGIY